MKDKKNGNDPDWSKYFDPHESFKRYEKAQKYNEAKQFWYPIFSFIYYFIWKPAVFVATVYLVWSIWQFLESTK